MKEILRTNNLSFSYSNSTFSLNEISINISPGEFASVIGRNGSGKSTLVKILSRVYKNYTGEVFFKNKEIFHYKNHEISKFIAYLPQHSFVFSDTLSVRQFLMNGRYPYKDFFDFKTSKKDNEVLEYSAELTSVQGFLDKSITELSGGERQKVLLTLSLIQLNPTESIEEKILIIDEPLTYLDINHQLEIYLLIKKLNEEKKLTVISVVHDLNLAMKFSGKVFLLSSGRLVKQGTPEEVINTDTLRNYFLVDSEIHKLADKNFINITNQYAG